MEDAATDRVIPESFICPITQQKMVDPYIDPDGNSYEKSAIDNWLSQNTVSPITRNPLSWEQLVPNRVLRTLIEDWDKGVGPFAPSTGTGTRASSAEDAPKVGVEESTLKRKPLYLIAVIDTSGSMQLSCDTAGAVANAEAGKGEFSRLDLVKHTLNTVIASLHEQDHICIIKFSTRADVVVSMTSQLTQDRKRVLMEKVKHLRPEAQTNLWDGIRSALDIAAHLPQPTEENGALETEIFVLTDGEPNLNPPRPIPETVERYMQKKCKHMESRMPRIHTFGYGYNLISHMLYDISRIGGGCFGFIPDASMVGTVFINALSNSLAGAHAAAAPADQPDPDATLTLDPAVVDVCDRFTRMLTHALHNSDREDAASADVRVSLVASFVESVKELLQQRTSSAAGAAGAAAPTNTVFTATNAAVASGSAAATPDASPVESFLRALLVDCEPSADANDGQISKAVEHEHFTRWGRHYLYSVLSAFQHRRCINFKDHAMQTFKTLVFSAEQERVEDIFLDITPPEPSINIRLATNSGYNRGHAVPAPAPNMRNYYNACGGCFAAESLVIAGTPSSVPVPSTPHPCSRDGEAVQAAVVEAGSLHKGSLVWTDAGWARVQCVVRLRYRGPLFAVGGMRLTEFHPVLLPPTAPSAPAAPSAPSAPTASTTGAPSALKGRAVFPG